MINCGMYFRSFTRWTNVDYTPFRDDGCREKWIQNRRTTFATFCLHGPMGRRDHESNLRRTQESRFEFVEHERPEIRQRDEHDRLYLLSSLCIHIIYVEIKIILNRMCIVSRSKNQNLIRCVYRVAILRFLSFSDIHQNNSIPHFCVSFRCFDICKI